MELDAVGMLTPQDEQWMTAERNKPGSGRCLYVPGVPAGTPASGGAGVRLSGPSCLSATFQISPARLTA
jgi:hypothetical protein